MGGYGMIRYIARRLVFGLITLWGITVITFAVIQLAPGDPAELQLASMSDGRVSEEAYERLRAYYNLDKPVVVQYLLWVGRLLRGDFGRSFHDGVRVIDKVGDAIWPTLSVALLATLLTYIIALPVGIFSAMRQGRPFDRISGVLFYILYAIPSYVIGMLLILYIGVNLDLLPFRGMHSDNFEELSALDRMIDGARHYVMITLSFALGNLAYYSRFTRQNLLEVVRQDYIRTARAKGLSETTVVFKHAFLNSLIPLITLLSLTLPFVLSGSVILETMFSWPGLGRLFFDSVLRRDYPTLMALSFFTAILVLSITLLTDLAYGLVDPRVKHEA